MNARFSFRISICLTVFLTLFISSSVNAQTPEPPAPQKVIAIFDGDTPSTVSPVCNNIPLKITIEAWNVGATGGDNYGDATVTIEGPECLIDSKGNSTPGSYSRTEIKGIFSGGPDGIIPLKDPDNPEFIYNALFVDGKAVRLSIVGTTLYIDIPIINPEVFESLSPLPIVTPTPGSFCVPVISNINNLRPGEVLSPAVVFVDVDNKPVMALSNVWYINGIQTNSVTWDGKETTLILQYTCSDNSAHEKRITIPAYQNNNVIPPSQQDSKQPENTSTFKTPAIAAGAFAAAAGAAGTVVAGGYVATRMRPLKTTKNAPPSRQSIPFRQNTSSTRETPPQEPRNPPRHRLTEQERNQLQTIRTMMQNQLIEYQQDYNNLAHDRQILVRMFKNNALKFVGKKGLIGATTVTTNSVSFVTQTLLDPVLNKAFSMHDTSQDSKIILRIHSLIQLSGERMTEVRREIIHLKNEINLINEKLAGN